MAEATRESAPGEPAAPQLDLKSLEKLRRPDIAMALGVVAILVVLILPMPRWLLDMSLAFSITFSVLILMTPLFIEKPLEFNAFPTVLLLATMVRLSLNLASTRLILAHGHEGTDAAGQVIEAFGGFVMSGNFVIGIIVFGILVIVNFVVITKGASRIAEVSARFTLDAMPGKQMAVDADLSSGLIDENAARARRKELEDESNFFGAMDGAAKFVRGDVIAGLLITFINIVAGIIIGVVRQDLTFAEAGDTYTRLTVGDGLVTQIPALIVSTAPGMVVTKAGITGATEKALFSQLGGHPKALGLCSFLLLALAVLPGIPMAPFLILAALTGGSARRAEEEGRSSSTAIRSASLSMRHAAPARCGPLGGRADRDRAADRQRPPRARLRAAVADQRRRRRPAPDRPDQGVEEAIGVGHGLRHAVGPHPGQYAAFGQRLRHPDQGNRGRPRGLEA